MKGRAVAVDLGATSVRVAIGEYDYESISYRIVRQVPHEPHQVGGHDAWDYSFLSAFCEEALTLARDECADSIAIDSWGVDIGFLDGSGNVAQPPICYRDPSHRRAFESVQESHRWLVDETGIQLQPFNTLFQLIARKHERPELFERDIQWLMLPDLLLNELGAERGYERSIASTTQLTGLDGAWNPRVFERLELPVPQSKIVSAGVAGERSGVKLIRGAGHDTACAFAAMHSPGSTLVNLGTWALVGRMHTAVDQAQWAFDNNVTHERTTWNEIRQLMNVPGFFVIQGLHRDLGVKAPISDWLDSANLDVERRIDMFDPALFAPTSMLDVVSAQLGGFSFSPQDWAGIALMSLVESIAAKALLFGSAEIRIAGGGSRNSILCQALARASRCPVVSLDAEMTIFGNLKTQAEVLFGREAASVLRPIEIARYSP